MNEPYLKGNKAGNRPHYYCFEDTNTGIYWMIPLSSQIDKYKRIVYIDFRYLEMYNALYYIEF